MVFALLACTVADSASEVEGAETGASATIEVTVTQARDTPVHRVQWSTPSAASGEVRYGTDGLASVIADDTESTEHHLWIAGVAAGAEWTLQVVSEADGETATSEVITIPAASAPPWVLAPTLTVPPADEVEGFQLCAKTGPQSGFITMLNRDGAPVWWAETLPMASYRARYDNATATFSWMEAGTEGGEPSFVTSTFDGVQTRVPAPPTAHHDFAMLEGGGFVTLALDDRELEGVTVRGERVVEVAPDGTNRTLWTSWDTLTWPGDAGKKNEDGTVEWPHANSMHYDAAAGKILVSLLYVDSVVQIDRATASLDWRFGGEGSDWTIEGESFAGQHGPMSFADGAGMALLDNGTPGQVEDAAVARVYDLDPEARTASPRWSFDAGGAHTGVLLGNAEWLADDSVVVNWGSAGMISRVDASGDTRWEVAFGLGTYTGFSDHVADLAGAKR
ncbi:hypothetical protein LBMAG42_52780 [Deltaproteobacteria bacterium]|nr:hypothetical protein LBMAG42_52780 [Deltaproteobacteria bacterium]